MSVRVPACHGIQLDPPPEGLRFGWLTAPPPRRAVVDLSAEISDDLEGETMWRFSHPKIDSVVEMRKLDGERYLYTSNSGLKMVIDLEDSRVSATAPDESLVLRSVAGIGLPMIGQAAGAVVIHAAAALRDGKATVICGLSGAGKSSLHSRMVGLGWVSVSDDIVLIDLEADRAVVWPGPAWARIVGDAPPTFAALGRRFQDRIKSAWDIEALMVHEPVPVDRLVFIERAEELEFAALDRDTAIGRISGHAPWLRRHYDGPEVLFKQAVRLASIAPAWSLRIPTGPEWLDRAAALLDEPRLPVGAPPVQ